MKKLFLVGFAGYPLLEMLYRGRTHYSMALAGGLAACFIGRVSRLRGTLPVKACLCGLGITALEGAFGLIWNRRHQIWDYRRQPLNWRGQVCVRFTALWCALSTGMLTVLQRIERHEKRRRM